MIKKKLLGEPKDMALRALLVLVMAVCAYSIFTYGRIIINSDSATVVTTVEAAWKNHSLFPKTWNYAQGEVYAYNYPLLFISLILYPLIHNDISREMAAFLQLVLSLASVGLLYKKGLKSKGYLVAFPLATIYLYGIAFYSMYDACYGGYLFWQPIIVLFLIRFWQSKQISIKRALIFAVILGWQSIVGARAIAEYTVPIIITIIIMFTISNNDKDVSEMKPGLIKSAKICLLTIISAACGLGVYKYISITRNINAREGIMTLPDSLADVAKGISKTIEYIFRIFGYDGSVQVSTVEGMRSLIGIGICILVCFIIPIIQACHIKEESDEVKILFYYTLVHNVILIACSIFFSFVTPYHLTATVVLAILVSARYIYDRFIENNGKLFSWIWILLFTVGCIIECVGTYKLSYNWKEKLNETKRVAEVLEEHGLTKGYATFWNAYNNRMYSSLDVQISAVSIDEKLLQEYLFLNDSNDYKQEDKKTFLMFTDEELEQDADWDVILNGYISPVEEFRIENVYINNWYVKAESRYNLNVFVYDEDYAQFLGNGASDGIITPIEMNFNYMGSKSTEEVVLNPGGLVYGPYTLINKGEYTVTYEGKNLSECTPVLMSEHEQDAIDYEILEQTDTSITVSAIFDEVCDDTQFRLENIGEDDATLYDILVVDSE